MKVAISIPDTVFRVADKTAKKLGISRSALYTKAIHQFLELYSQADVTERLNQVYPATDSSLDSVLKEMQNVTLKKEPW